MAATPRSKPPAHAAYLPADWDNAIVSALQALQRGNAEPEQQKMALRWIIEVNSRAYDMSYRPGVDGERETCFAEGRRFVGSQIVKLLRLNLNQIRKAQNG